MMKLPAKVGVLVLDLLAAVLVLYSVSLIFLSNFNMGNLMVWLLTVCVAGYAVFRRPLNLWFSAGSGRVVFWVLAVLAGEFAAAHPDTLVITSGGQGRDEWRPEGDAMRDYLIAKGLPANRVLAESGSTSTEENFAFSLTILREHGFDETTPIVYVSNAFHCYRAGKYAALAGFTKATALPAATPLRSVLPCYLREALALLYYWVFKTSASGPMHAMVGLLELNKNFFYK